MGLIRNEIQHKNWIKIKINILRRLFLLFFHQDFFSFRLKWTKYFKARFFIMFVKNGMFCVNNSKKGMFSPRRHSQVIKIAYTINLKIQSQAQISTTWNVTVCTQWHKKSRNNCVIWIAMILWIFIIILFWASQKVLWLERHASDSQLHTETFQLTIKMLLLDI